MMKISKSDLHDEPPKIGAQFFLFACNLSNPIYAMSFLRVQSVGNEQPFPFDGYYPKP
jgi:hypothetical protein